MELIYDIRTMQARADSLRSGDQRIGFVPTMGYLHEGHLSLVRKAQSLCDTVVVSIFVNPTQFAPTEDLEAYPRDLERDKALCEKEGVDYIFFPEADMMYPEPYRTYVTVEELTGFLCGKSRPTHFRGVTTVVTKLFNIVKPHVAVFGQKDFQQAQIIRQMVRDLNMDLDVVISPIVREADGLAMSSRNKYLTAGERRNATALVRSLRHARKLIAAGETRVDIIAGTIRDILTDSGGTIDYVEIVDARHFTPVKTIGNETLIALAVKFGSTRLIDNFYIPVLEKEDTWQ